MKRFAVLALVVAVVAAVAALIGALFAVPPLLVEQRIAEQISTWTGRQVTFAGEPDFSLYPEIGFRINGVTIANPAGMIGQPLLVADRLTARPRLLPLLIGRIEFDEFRLVNPRISLMVDADGRFNWLDPQRMPADMKLGRFVIDGGMVAYDNAVTGRHEAFEEVGLDLAWPSMQETASGAGSFRWREQTVEVNGSVTKPFDLLTGGGSPLRFALNTVPIRATFNGNLLRLDRFQLEGAATIATPSLRRAIEWLSLAALDDEGPTFGAASIDGTVNWIGPTISFSGATLELDGNSAEGFLSANFAGAHPAVHGTLAFQTLDLTPYLEAMRAKVARSGPAAPFSPASLPLAGFSDLDLRVSANEMLIGSARIGLVAASAEVQSGRFSIEIGDSQFYGGKLRGALGATLVDGMLKATATAHLSRIDAGAALDAVADVQPLDGMGTGTMTLSAEGSTWIALTQGLTGRVTFRLADGSLSGIDVSELSSLIADPLAESIEPASGSTAFSVLRGTLTIKSGIAAINDFWAEGDGYMALMAGWGSLLSGAVEAKASVSVGKDRDISLAIGGDVWSPAISLIRPPVLEREEQDVPAPQPERPDARTNG